MKSSTMEAYKLLWFDQLQGLANDGERLERISEEEFSGAYQAYHTHVELFFARWRPVIVACSATAGGVLGVIGGPIVMTVVGIGAARAAELAVKHIEHALKASLHFPPGEEDRVQVNPESMDTLSRAVFRSDPHSSQGQDFTVSVNVINEILTVIPLVVRRGCTYGRHKHREISRLLAGVLEDVIEGLDLNQEGQSQ